MGSPHFYAVYLVYLVYLVYFIRTIVRTKKKALKKHFFNKIYNYAYFMIITDHINIIIL
jgi:hypothetical protein